MPFLRYYRKLLANPLRLISKVIYVVDFTYCDRSNQCDVFKEKFETGIIKANIYTFVLYKISFTRYVIEASSIEDDAHSKHSKGIVMPENI